MLPNNRFTRGALALLPKLALLPRLALSPKLAKGLRDEEGAATAEYAIATMAAVAFAGLLVVIMQSDEVRVLLENIIRTALTLDE